MFKIQYFSNNDIQKFLWKNNLKFDKRLLNYWESRIFLFSFSVFFFKLRKAEKIQHSSFKCDEETPSNRNFAKGKKPKILNWKNSSNYTRKI